MGEVQIHKPVLLIAAVSSRYDSAIDNWFRETASTTWGPIALESPLFDFTETSYYEETMGTNLKKQLFAFERLIDPATVTKSKLQSNRWESDYIAANEHAEQRPLNIDPGYISEAKLVLATTKDRDHRLYLQDGIFAEVTLHFKRGVWEKSRWTYPDYQRQDFHAFFTKCRDYLRRRYAAR